MTLLAASMCVLCQLCLVIGQLLLKHAMNATRLVPVPWAAVGWNLAGGISSLGLWFFTWLGLLRDWELSRLFPFEGLSPPLLALGAWIFLGERISPRAWAGVVLIGCGVALVAEG
jgi:drug/metabolite transporter (DMT)-like permease